MHLHNFFLDDRTDNDVALLKVSEPFDLGEERHVKSVGLNTDASCPTKGQMCEVAGWGATTEGGKLDKKIAVASVTVWRSIIVSLCIESFPFEQSTWLTLEITSKK